MRGKIKRRLAIFNLIVLPVVFLMSECGRMIALEPAPDESVSLGNIIYAGVRSSSYGIKPFPEPPEWQNAMVAMSNHFGGSVPCGIWVVGEFYGPYKCRLFFPSDGESYTNVLFEDTDKHERYLQYFDRVGIKVFLQVEPAHADVNVLIDLVLDRYKHHECVIGFGVDVEWYRESDNPKWGVKVSDRAAEAWEAGVKSHNSRYRLFLKHWNRDWMPPKYRGDIIFVSDSQMLKDFDAMVQEFVDYWAEYFKPNAVFFQIGYKSDRPWWKKFLSPPRSIGRAIASKIEQECGIFWVDFTLRDVLPSSREKIEKK